MEDLNGLNSGKKIDEALNLLNEAAREKKDELRKLVGEKYSNIREVLTEVAMNNKEILNQVKRITKDAVEQGQERLSTAVTDLEDNVRQKPWPFLGGAAIAGLLLGYMMGARRR